MVNWKHPLFTVFQVVFQCGQYGTERQFVPGYVGGIEEARFQGFEPGIELWIEDTRKVEEMHLVGVRYVDNRVQRPKFDLRTRFFGGLVGGALGGERKSLVWGKSGDSSVKFGERRFK